MTTRHVSGQTHPQQPLPSHLNTSAIELSDMAQIPPFKEQTTPLEQAQRIERTIELLKQAFPISENQDLVFEQEYEKTTQQWKKRTENFHSK